MTKKKIHVNLVNGIYIHLVVKLPIQLFEWNVTSFIVGVSWIMQFLHSFLRLPQAYLFMCLWYITLSRADRSGRACKLLYLDTTHSRDQRLFVPISSTTIQGRVKAVFSIFLPQIYLSTHGLQLTGCRGSREQCLWTRWFVIRQGSLQLAVYCWANYWCETRS